MVRRALVKRNAQECPQRQTVRAAPGDAALAVEPFEVADEQHAEVDARRQARLTAFLFAFVEDGTASLDPAVEVGLSQQRVELLIEGVACRRCELVRRDEQRFLPRLPFA